MDTILSRQVHSSTSLVDGWIFDELLDQGSDNEVKAMEMDATLSNTGDFPDVESVSESLLELSTVNASESFVESEMTPFSILPDAPEEAPPRELPPTATPAEKEMFLKVIVDTVSSQFPELSFATGYHASDSNNPVLTITQRSLFSHLPLGLTSRVTITIQYKRYSVHVLMRLWSEGEIKSVNDVVELCHMIGKKSKYKFCPGMDPDHYDNEYYKPIQFYINSVRLTQFPFSRVDSVNCKLWFLPALNANATEKAATEVKCTACKRLFQYLNLQKKRTLAESPGKNIRRQNPSSQAHLQYMSPASQQACKCYTQCQRSSNIRKLARLEENEVVLDNEQHKEMSAVVEAVQAEELERLFQGEQHGVGSLMKMSGLLIQIVREKSFPRNSKAHIVYCSCNILFYSHIETSGGHGNMITI